MNHQISYRRKRGYGSPWMAVCSCGHWHSQPCDQFEDARRAGSEHSDELIEKDREGRSHGRV